MVLTVSSSRSTARPAGRALPALGLLLGLAWLLAMPHPVQAQLRTYELDPVHTRVWFEVEHLRFSKAMGSFSAPRGTLWLDRAAPQNARVEVEIDLATLDLGDPAWNRRMAKRDGFNTAAHPVARFRSERVEVVSPEHWRVHGQLSLRGTTQPVVLETRFNRAARHPLTLRRTVGFSATAEISRRNFGIDAWSNMVADRVLLRIEVEATRSRARAAKSSGAESSGAAPPATGLPVPAESTDPAPADAAASRSTR